MKVLIVHNRYRYRGGEDIVVEHERTLLEERGHTVINYIRHNDEIDIMSRRQKAALLWRTTYSPRTDRGISTLLDAERPDVVHVHNIVPLVTPAVYVACRRAAVPVVQTLHNYRLLCPVGSFFRDGHVCEECPTHGLQRATRHGCYRGSRIQTFAIARMLAKHRRAATWSTLVHRYICLTEFARAKHAGIAPPDRFAVKPNFLPRDPGSGDGEREGAIFLGRLDPIKGIAVLLRAAAITPQVPIRVAGDGPLRDVVARAPGVSYLGPLPSDAALHELRRACVAVLPSVCYEAFPLVLIEAFASGTPVLASRHGPMTELVAEGKTGFLIPPGNSDALGERLHWALTHPEAMREMGRNARAEFETKYTASANYRRLMAIYREAIQCSAA